MEYQKLVFNLYKDVAFKNTESLKSKIGKLIDKIDFKKLCVDIINYQIDRYHTQLHKHENIGLDYEHTVYTKLNPL